MSLPQPLHIAAAIAINKSKPKYLSVQEYILALRRCLKTRQENGQTYREIDHSAFWQAQFDTVYAALETERDASFILRQENEALKAQVAELQAQLQPGGRKRKTGGQQDRDAAKKSKSDALVTAEFGSVADAEPATRALRHIHSVQSLCKGEMYGTEASDLCYHLTQATEALTHIVESLPSKRLKATDDLTTTIIALARSCISIFHGLKRLDSLSSSDIFSSHVVFACVGFLDGLFTSIEEAASVQAKAKQIGVNRKTDLLPCLTNLTASIISNLQASAATCSPHADILEGVTYYLLVRIGEATHELLMDGPRNEDIETEIRNLPLPDDKRLDPTRQTSLQAVLISAPYMLTILQRVISQKSNAPLVQEGRLRLQRTLVDCIFGHGTRGPNASTDILKLPEPLGAAPTAVKEMKPKDMEKGKEWFEAELWALVGWDILGRQEDL